MKIRHIRETLNNPSPLPSSTMQQQGKGTTQILRAFSYKGSLRAGTHPQGSMEHTLELGAHWPCAFSYGGLLLYPTHTGASHSGQLKYATHLRPRSRFLSGLSPQ